MNAVLWGFHHTKDKMQQIHYSGYKMDANKTKPCCDVSVPCRPKHSCKY